MKGGEGVKFFQRSPKKIQDGANAESRLPVTPQIAWVVRNRDKGKDSSVSFVIQQVIQSSGQERGQAGVNVPMQTEAGMPREVTHLNHTASQRQSRAGTPAS